MADLPPAASFGTARGLGVEGARRSGPDLLPVASSSCGGRGGLRSVARRAAAGHWKSDPCLWWPDLASGRDGGADPGRGGGALAVLVASGDAVGG